MGNWGYWVNLLIQLVVSCEACQLSIQFSICWKLTFHCFGKCKSNTGLSVATDNSFYDISILHWPWCWSQYHFKCNLVSHTEKLSGVTTRPCCIGVESIARTCYGNMFFYIRHMPDGAIGDQPMARQGDQPWTFLLYLQLVIKLLSIQTTRFIQWSSNDFKRETGRTAMVYDSRRRYELSKCQCVRICGSDKL